MRISLSMIVAAGACAMPFVASAAPTLDLRGAAARIVVIPGTRQDIQVVLARASSALPIRIHTFGQSTFVSGDVGHKIHACNGRGSHRRVGVWGRGDIPFEELPLLVARTPMDVRITAGDAVFGEVGRSGSLDLTNRGCGDWTVANVTGLAHLDQSGSGDTRGGGAGRADLDVSGSGDITMQGVRGAVTAVSAGSGNITVASMNGRFNARIAGSGDVRVDSGEADDVNAEVAGSGSVAFGGVARALHASIAGSGDITVGRVDGPISKHVFGSGDVVVGRR